MAMITLTTDFGTDDPYVAIMKGVVAGIDPGATVVDLCHNIAPQNIAQAAYLISTSVPYFPKGTIHVVVVDPGVGTQRGALLVITPEAYFIAPDNGVLTYVVEEAFPDVEAFELTNSHFWLTPVSSTFHGRDIFAPVAAHLSRGVEPQELGEPLPSIATIPIPRPQPGEQGVIVGRVIHIDHFGNLITDIMSRDLPAGRLFIEVSGHIIDDLSTSYDEVEELLAIIGSSDRLEVSLRNGSAARYLKARLGTEVKVGISKTSLRGRSGRQSR